MQNAEVLQKCRRFHLCLCVGVPACVNEAIVPASLVNLKYYLELTRFLRLILIPADVLILGKWRLLSVILSDCINTKVKKMRIYNLAPSQTNLFSRYLSLPSVCVSISGLKQTKKSPDCLIAQITSCSAARGKGR